MNIESTKFEGVKVITLPYSEDNRGSFVKTFHQSLFLKSEIDFTLRESYFSLSNEGVIRGMHFQLPPHQHSKIVFCPQGAILDVIVDLRIGSNTYGQHFALELSDQNHKAIFIPEGFAHGFKSLSNNTLTYYLVSSEYSKAEDTGVLYDSFGFDWGVAHPIISSRDLSFMKLAEFKSPFSLLGTVMER